MSDYPTPEAYEAACAALWKHRDALKNLVAVLDSPPRLGDQSDYISAMAAARLALGTRPLPDRNEG